MNQNCKLVVIGIVTLIIMKYVLNIDIGTIFEKFSSYGNKISGGKKEKIANGPILMKSGDTVSLQCPKTECPTSCPMKCPKCNHNIVEDEDMIKPEDIPMDDDMMGEVITNMPLDTIIEEPDEDLSIEQDLVKLNNQPAILSQPQQLAVHEKDFQYNSHPLMA